MRPSFRCSEGSSCFSKAECVVYDDRFEKLEGMVKKGGRKRERGDGTEDVDPLVSPTGEATIQI